MAEPDAPTPVNPTSPDTGTGSCRSGCGVLLLLVSVGLLGLAGFMFIGAFMWPASSPENMGGLYSLSGWALAVPGVVLLVVALWLRLPASASPTEEPWTCARCRERNDFWRPACRGCGAQRPDQTRPA